MRMARVVGDARGEIQGLAEGIALLEEDGPRVQANVRRGSPAAARPSTISRAARTPGPGSRK